jgi:hypothetical protein
MSRQTESLGWKITRAAFFVPLVLLLLPVLLLCAVFYWMYRITLYLLIWLLWLRNGKDVLFIYSDSPIWQGYMKDQILPLVRERAVVLNWSERKTWQKWSLPVRVFHTYAGGRDFNPMVLWFRPFPRAKSFRFFSAFREWKHGKIEAVEQLRDELVRQL